MQLITAIYTVVIMPPFQAGFMVESFYSIIIIFSSLMVYLSTKEIYNLSLHKGVKYFRNAFLFFALAFFFRVPIFFMSVFELPRFFIHPQAIGLITMFIFMYLSTIAMFYLLYSVMWKKMPKQYENIYTLHLLAILISVISISTQHFLVLLALHLFVLLFITIEGYNSYQKSKKKGVFNLYVIYMLLFIFWILNILDMLLPNFLVAAKLLIYAASSGLFLLILFRVLKKTGI